MDDLDIKGLVDTFDILDSIDNLLVPTEFSEVINGYAIACKVNPKKFYFSSKGFNTIGSSYTGIEVEYNDDLHAYIINKQTISIRSSMRDLIVKLMRETIISCYIYEEGYGHIFVSRLVPMDDRCIIESTFCKFDPYFSSYEHKLAVQIYEKFKVMKRYSIMIFNPTEQQKKYIPFYVQMVIMTMTKKFCRLIADINLTKPGYDFKEHIHKRTNKNVSTIQVIDNIMEAYKDAIEESKHDEYRVSQTKNEMNKMFDKFGDTEGLITIVFCNEKKDVLEKKMDEWESDGSPFRSMYRKGRIDSEVIMDDKTSTFICKHDNTVKIYDITNDHNHLRKHPICSDEI